MTTRRILDFYTETAAMTRLESHARAFDALPRDVNGLARAVQGLLLHEQWARAYGVELASERRAESHLRTTEQMLERICLRTPAPLTEERDLNTRLVGVCRHFSVLLVAMLRAQGVPARARCGFGAYFEPGKLVDHWVCEYWNAAQRRWLLVDAQIDALQADAIKPAFDLFDVPRDRFVVAGDAWVQCRRGELDPDVCGIMHMKGMWFVAGNVVRDAASLNNMEMLPWDVWGAMPAPDESVEGDALVYFDRIAALTRDPDRSFDELRDTYEHDPALHVPSRVWNAVAQREDVV